MLTIDNNNNITLTRGDTLTMTVSLTQGNQTYTPDQDDVIRFALSTGYVGESTYSLKVTKTIPNDTLTFTLSSEDTSLEYKPYNYDIEITHGDGSVDTVISGKLTITGEVK